MGTIRATSHGSIGNVILECLSRLIKGKKKLAVHDGVGEVETLRIAKLIERGSFMRCK